MDEGDIFVGLKALLKQLNHKNADVEFFRF